MSSNIGGTMQIRCVNTKAYLFKINIEDYIKQLEKIGISQQTPLVVEVPCKRCKMIETYYIYKDHYDMVESHKKVIKV